MPAESTRWGSWESPTFFTEAQTSAINPGVTAPSPVNLSWPQPTAAEPMIGVSNALPAWGTTSMAPTPDWRSMIGVSNALPAEQQSRLAPMTDWQPPAVPATDEGMTGPMPAPMAGWNAPLPTGTEARALPTQMPQRLLPWLGSWLGQLGSMPTRQVYPSLRAPYDAARQAARAAQFRWPGNPGTPMMVAEQNPISPFSGWGGF